MTGVEVDVFGLLVGAVGLVGDGVMNFRAHGLHRTCPQGMVSMAFEALERGLVQAGQMKGPLVVSGLDVADLEDVVVEDLDSDAGVVELVEVENVMGLSLIHI